MNIDLLVIGGISIVMAGLYLQAKIFEVIHCDPPATYKLYRVRDKLIRLVSEGKIDRDDPAFDQVYRNVSLLLVYGHLLCGPDGWANANRVGRRLAQYENDPGKGRIIPVSEFPEALKEVTPDLEDALKHLAKNHIGFSTLLSARQREIRRIQRENAQRFLERMRGRTAPA